ncbi:hypothetical protein JOD67_004247 [Tenggerimyces flavus]|nr:hypothetical protein [Tenggerimyces flavus]
MVGNAPLMGNVTMRDASGRFDGGVPLSERPIHPPGALDARDHEAELVIYGGFAFMITFMIMDGWSTVGVRGTLVP